MIRELQILSLDGEARIVPLETDRISLSRSSVAELCYPNDAGLSRQHLTIEREVQEWRVRDLGSKNRTLLNGARVTVRSVLKPGDRITVGHLTLVFEPSADRATRAVVFVEGAVDDKNTTSSTVITSLESVIGGSAKAADPVIGSAHINALIRAGNELAGYRPLPELFRFILDLSIQAVSPDRGVLIILEKENELVVRANKGEGFRISATVRDRVLKSRASVLVRDTRSDDAFREQRSIVEQNIRTLMAVPLQTQDRIIGLIYLDSPSFIREFTKDDLSLLTVMANVAAIRIEHSRLAEIEQAKQLMAHELEQAAEIQQRSGKGIPASLLMMSLQARFQALVDEPENLAEVMTRLNRLMAANCPDNKFINLLFCVIDPARGEVVHENVGHNPPLIVREDGRYELVEGGGPPLGILASLKYEQNRCRHRGRDAR